MIENTYTENIMSWNEIPGDVKNVVYKYIGKPAVFTAGFLHKELLFERSNSKLKGEKKIVDLDNPGYCFLYVYSKGSRIILRLVEEISSTSKGWTDAYYYASFTPSKDDFYTIRNRTKLFDSYKSINLDFYSKDGYIAIFKKMIALRLQGYHDLTLRIASDGYESSENLEKLFIALKVGNTLWEMNEKYGVNNPLLFQTQYMSLSYYSVGVGLEPYADRNLNSGDYGDFYQRNSHRYGKNEKWAYKPKK